MQRRREPRTERRKAQVEINLLAETETRRVRRLSGCSLPFFGGAGLLLIAIEALRTVTG